MKNRIIFGCILVLLLAVAVFVGGYLFRAFTLAMCILAVHETAGVVMKKRDPYLLAPLYAASCASVFCIGLTDARYVAVIWIAFMICIVTVSVCCGIEIPDAMHVVFLAVYPVAFLLLILYGCFCLPRTHAVPFTVLTVAAPSLCDTLAYFGGIRFGKKKLCPSISPHKTIAGSLFAIIGGLLSGA
ncbi:MAG: phosphatidate cytidylyltransferase, partial [Lachnospiraceae bacterium]|nr:phosphatidate cytidylyltransferase [Lachnospiraceae bacterium]